MPQCKFCKTSGELTPSYVSCPPVSAPDGKPGLKLISCDLHLHACAFFICAQCWNKEAHLCKGDHKDWEENIPNWAAPQTPAARKMRKAFRFRYNDKHPTVCNSKNSSCPACFKDPPPAASHVSSSCPLDTQAAASSSMNIDSSACSSADVANQNCSDSELIDEEVAGGSSIDMELYSKLPIRYQNQSTYHTKLDDLKRSEVELKIADVRRAFNEEANNDASPTELERETSDEDPSDEIEIDDSSKWVKYFATNIIAYSKSDRIDGACVLKKSLPPLVMESSSSSYSPVVKKMTDTEEMHDVNTTSPEAILYRLNPTLGAARLREISPSELAQWTKAPFEIKSSPVVIVPAKERKSGHGDLMRADDASNSVLHALIVHEAAAMTDADKLVKLEPGLSLRQFFIQKKMDHASSMNTDSSACSSAEVANQNCSGSEEIKNIKVLGNLKGYWPLRTLTDSPITLKIRIKNDENQQNVNVDEPPPLTSAYWDWNGRPIHFGAKGNPTFLFEVDNDAIWKNLCQDQLSEGRYKDSHLFVMHPHSEERTAGRDQGAFFPKVGATQLVTGLSNKDASSIRRLGSSAVGGSQIFFELTHLIGDGEGGGIHRSNLVAARRANNTEMLVIESVMQEQYKAIKKAHLGLEIVIRVEVTLMQYLSELAEMKPKDFKKTSLENKCVDFVRFHDHTGNFMRYRVWLRQKQVAPVCPKSSDDTMRDLTLVIDHIMDCQRPRISTETVRLLKLQVRCKFKAALSKMKSTIPPAASSSSPSQANAPRKGKKHDMAGPNPIPNPTDVSVSGTVTKADTITSPAKKQKYAGEITFNAASSSSPSQANAPRKGGKHNRAEPNPNPNPNPTDVSVSGTVTKADTITSPAKKQKYAGEVTFNAASSSSSTRPTPTVTNEVGIESKSADDVDMSN
jgi:hypothetical protein